MNDINTFIVNGEEMSAEEFHRRGHTRGPEVDVHLPRYLMDAAYREEINQQLAAIFPPYEIDEAIALLLEQAIRDQGAKDRT